MTYHPTTADLKCWRTLCCKAWQAVIGRAGSAADLARAANRAGKAVAPSPEALTNLCVPLIRLAREWPRMDAATQRANRDRLKFLADGLGPLVGCDNIYMHRKAREAETPGWSPVNQRPGNRLGLHIPPDPLLADDPRPERAPRADIDG